MPHSVVWLFFRMPYMHASPMQEGQKDGMGIYTWPNAASYRGEWRDGCMHGVGTFESPDGTYYQVRPNASLSHM